MKIIDIYFELVFHLSLTNLLRSLGAQSYVVKKSLEQLSKIAIIVYYQYLFCCKILEHAETPWRGLVKDSNNTAWC